MNRHERRRQAASARRNRHNSLYLDYVRHLPQVSMEAPLEGGCVYHVVYAHDDDCGIYRKVNGSLAGLHLQTGRDAARRTEALMMSTLHYDVPGACARLAAKCLFDAAATGDAGELGKARNIILGLADTAGHVAFPEMLLAELALEGIRRNAPRASSYPEAELVARCALRNFLPELGVAIAVEAGNA
jgi:hypothetical protein